MKAVYKRELNSYFSSMIGYVYTAVVLIFLGLFFMLTNILGQYPYFAGALSSLTIILVFTVPILTMKSIAEERRSKTDQMLLTYPVKTSAVILGKYLAMVTVYAIPLAIGCLCPMILSWSGAGSFLIDYSTILAFLCLGALFVAIGMFISSLTESQVIAAVVTMGVYLLIFFWTGLVNYIPKTALASLIGFLLIAAVVVFLLYRLTRSGVLTAVVGVIAGGGLVAWYLIDSTILAGLLNRFLGAFSITDAIGNFAGYSVFDLKGLLLFLSFAALFVFLTIQSLQKRRWS
jgi:ABC-2 type transport system permease protein